MLLMSLPPRYSMTTDIMSPNDVTMKFFSGRFLPSNSARLKRVYKSNREEKELLYRMTVLSFGIWDVRCEVMEVTKCSKLIFSLINFSFFNL